MATQPTFIQLRDSERDLLFKSMEARSFKTGDVIITQGALQGTMYVVEKGRVRVERRGKLADGSTGNIFISTVGPGEVFGEMSFVDRAPASATVTAETDVELLGIGRAEIDRVSNGDPAFPGRFYHCLALVLVDRLRSTSRRLS